MFADRPAYTIYLCLILRMNFNTEICIVSLEEAGNALLGDKSTSLSYDVIWKLPKMANIALLPQYHDCHVVDLYEHVTFF